MRQESSSTLPLFWILFGVEASNNGDLVVPNAIEEAVGKALDLFASNVAINSWACLRKLLDLTEATIEFANEF